MTHPMGIGSEEIYQPLLYHLPGQISTFFVDITGQAVKIDLELTPLILQPADVFHPPVALAMSCCFIFGVISIIFSVKGSQLKKRQAACPLSDASVSTICYCFYIPLLSITR